MFDPPFRVRQPDRARLPIVFNSPHSGRLYPEAFTRASRLDPATLRRSEDAFVDLIVEGVIERGVPLLQALFPRAWLDVNREPYELDPAMFEGRLPAFANTRSLRVAGGLGTIPRIVGEANEIYAARLPASEATRRIESFYKPYHAALRALLEQTETRFGFVVLIDCHSMPSSSLARDEQPRAQIVLGDRFGTSCGRLVIDTAEAALRAKGYSILRNKPYAGGFITEHYGQPETGRHALQIEFARSLYIDERTLEPHAGLLRLRDDMLGLVDALAAAPLHLLAGQRHAAE